MAGSMHVAVFACVCRFRFVNASFGGSFASFNLRVVLKNGKAILNVNKGQQSKMLNEKKQLV